MCPCFYFARYWEVIEGPLRVPISNEVREYMAALMDRAQPRLRPLSDMRFHDYAVRISRSTLANGNRGFKASLVAYEWDDLWADCLCRRTIITDDSSHETHMGAVMSLDALCTPANYHPIDVEHSGRGYDLFGGF